jgi:hypothetical protein
MTLAIKLASHDPRIIKDALFSILGKITPAEVLALDAQFETTDIERRPYFFTQFEGAVPTRSPKLLEQWTHFLWIRLELTNLINQRASLNHVQQIKKKKYIKAQEITPFETSLSEEVRHRFQSDSSGKRDKGMPFDEFQRSLFDTDMMPTSAQHQVPVLESINRAIKDYAERGASIEESIQILRQMTLQIIGTEHPTDPLSQVARDTLIKLANAIGEKDPDEEIIKELFRILVDNDAIPHARRSVTEEVRRNIRTTLSTLYDNVPHLVEEILNAYKMYYGEATCRSYEHVIFDAIEGGREIDGIITPPLLRDASWPGLDADGNPNITDAATRESINIYRKTVSKKHIETLNATVVETTKHIERKLRETLNNSFSDLSKDVLKIDSLEVRIILNQLIDDQNIASNLLNDRRYPELVPHYEKVLHYLGHSFEKSSDKTNKTTLLDTVVGLVTTAQTLMRLAEFSGFYRAFHKNRLTDCKGAIQSFQKIIEDYQNRLEVDGNAIYINVEGKKNVPVSKFVIDYYRTLVDTHRDIFEAYPIIYKQLRYFGIQLHCYGMTYGMGHIRQDSSIFRRVWNVLCAELKLNPKFSQSEFLQPLIGKNYTDLTGDERAALHEKLLSGSDESNQILAQLFHQHKFRLYSSGHEDIALVDTELKRLQLAIEHADMIEDLIISNCQSAADIMAVWTLFAMFPVRPHQMTPRIVPLLETRQDLVNYEQIVTNYVKTKIQQQLELIYDSEVHKSRRVVCDTFSSRQEIKETIQSYGREDFRKMDFSLRDLFKNITIEIMVGFSDTERVSGLPALITIKQVKESFIQLMEDFGVTPKIYHGPGGDLTRGGLKRRDEKATLQGKARDVLITPSSAQWYRENQFYHTFELLSNPAKHMDISILPAIMQDELAIFASESASFYEFMHDSQTGLGKLLGYLLGQTEHWIVTTLNSSSRATQRGVAENLSDRTASVQTGGERPASYIQIDNLRAISAMFMQQMLRLNVNFLGPCYGMRKIGLERTVRLYDHSETFRDLVVKESIGTVMRNISFSAYALFADHPELSPLHVDQMTRQQWADECKKDYPEQLKGMDFKALVKDPQEKYKLLVMLSKFFAYIQVECEETVSFLAKLNRFIEPAHGKDKTNLLAHYPVCDAQIKELAHLADPLFYLLARHCHQVANGECLDQKLPGLNDDGIIPDGVLSGIGSLLGNYGAGIMAYWATQSGYYESLYVDYSRTGFSPGFLRARSEAEAMGREVGVVSNKEKSTFRFFEMTPEQSAEQLAKLEGVVNAQRVL